MLARCLGVPLLESSCCVLARRRSASSSAPAVGQWPVVIVGAGPTGLTLSTLLSNFGVPSLLLEKARALTSHPQAHYINNRSMEVFRQISDGSKKGGGSLAEKITAASPPLEQWRKFVYCQSLTGPIFGEADHFKGQETALAPDVSPEAVTHFSQNRLLPMLLDSATAHNNVGQVLFGHHLKSFRPGPDGVALHVDSLEATYSMSCKYLVAADGASSGIRRALGVKMLGQPALQHLINIHFWAPGLARRLRFEQPAMLYFVFNPQAVVAVVAHDLNEGEFVAQVPFYPPMQKLEQFTDAFCKELLQKASGWEAVHIVIKSVRSWTMSAQVAEKFQVGNVFLAGDTAHHFPPAGGFGMNTGIQDAHNLAWKLAYVLGGERLNTVARDEPRAFAGPGLLASYQAERQPVAQANMELSVANFEEAMRVPKALGLDPAAARLLSTAATAAHSAVPGLGEQLLRAGMRIGMAASGTEGPLRSWRLPSLRQIFERGASLRLQFPKEDLGFTYRGSAAAILPDSRMSEAEWHFGSRKHDGEASTVGAAAELSSHGGKLERDAPFRPSNSPGCRLPHIWLHLLYSRQVHHSLLDLVGGQWVLVISGSGAARVWSAAASNIRSEGFPLRIAHVVRSTQAGKELHHLLKKHPAGANDDDSDDDYLRNASAARNVRNGSKERSSIRQRVVRRLRKKTDVQVACVSEKRWAPLRAPVSEDGAILVRPDGHVAWRCINGPPLESGAAGVAAAERRLRRSLNALLLPPTLSAHV